MPKLLDIFICWSFFMNFAGVVALAEAYAMPNFLDMYLLAVFPETVDVAARAEA